MRYRQTDRNWGMESTTVMASSVRTVTDKAFVHFRGFRTSDAKPRRRRLGRRRGVLSNPEMSLKRGT